MPTTTTLQEFIIAVHFGAPLPLNVVDLADWVSRFSGDFPIVQQLPSLPQVNIPSASSPPHLQFQMMANASLPRMYLRTADNKLSVQLQEDRFAFGWHRTGQLGEPSDYPGFQQMEALFERHLARFEEWTLARLHQRPSHRIVELTYGNASLMEDRTGRRKRLSEILRFIQPGSRRLIGFQTSWMEPLGETLPPTAVVSASVALGTAPPAVAALLFNFTGIGAVAPNAESKHILVDLHNKIREMYESEIVHNA